MRIFLDTEWADQAGRELVSLALVSEDGEHRFYSEVAILPERPTDFVRHVVYPLLDRGCAAKTAIDFTRDLRGFLAQFESPFVLFDYRTDCTLFRYALNGFDLPAGILQGIPPAPPVATTLVLREEVRSGIETYFGKNPALAHRKHHAAVDADAFRWAFIDALAGSDQSSC
ncbi:3'-5' exoribonuclease [Xanthomonas campestris pv. incanae]|uniref:3'-5' exoribonuclease n=1 Tax=Xanthomonas campestris TaxID=339 RepID=UPI0023688661|nr:3'-5' exoribonuclease [Xanthomonas campestris]WDJ98482.1 3'-5' exoribonuclease [Xanthomonas campestris pv. incanae]